MHELALEQRRDLGVRAPWHVGDITWGLRQHEGREDEWKIRIWQDGDRTVAEQSPLLGRQLLHPCDDFGRESHVR